MLYRMSYHTALYAVAWVAKRRGEISQDDFNAINKAIQDRPSVDGQSSDNCLCPQLEQMSYDIGVSNNVIDSAKQPLKSINWSGLLAFIQALLPIILEFIKIINPPKPPVPTPSLVGGNGNDSNPRV